jgi:hypothetical protein
MGGGQITFGSDVNGFSPLPGPRFGVHACPNLREDEGRARHANPRAQADAQTHPVLYPEALTRRSAVLFERDSAPDREQPYTQAESKTWQLLARERLSSGAGSESPAAARARRRHPRAARDFDRILEAHWGALASPQSSSQTAPLERSRAGLRDFDMNLDGMAHYGMLPDFLQDTANVLRSRGISPGEKLAPLFHAAEDYLRMWEKAVTVQVQP